MSDNSGLFEEVSYHYGVGTDGVPVDFEFKYIGDLPMEYYQKSCGCVADIIIDNDNKTVSGKMTPSSKNNNGKKYAPYNQVITVFIADGRSPNVIENFELKPNDEKTRVALTISGQVKAS